MAQKRTLNQRRLTKRQVKELISSGARPRPDLSVALEPTSLQQSVYELEGERYLVVFGGTAFGLAGKGDIRVRNVEFRGWDVSASVADGAPRTGESRWSAGEGSFTLKDRGIVLAGLRLEAGSELTFVKGTVSFSQDANLTVRTAVGGRRESRAPDAGQNVLKISGPLDVPRVSVEGAAARQPAD